MQISAQEHLGKTWDSMQWQAKIELDRCVGSKDFSKGLVDLERELEAVFKIPRMGLVTKCEHETLLSLFRELQAQRFLAREAYDKLRVLRQRHQGTTKIRQRMRQRTLFIISADA